MPLVIDFQSALFGWLIGFILGFILGIIFWAST